MATMFPADVTSFLTTGEEATYSFLQRTARPDGKFLCWYAPDIEEREPDFILLSPDCGLVVLEVKDWLIDQLLEVDGKSVLLSVNGREERRKQPLAQAREYVGSLLTLLNKHAPRMADGKPLLPCPVTGGAVLPHISREEFRAAGLGEVMEEGRIIFWDELHEESPLRRDASGRSFACWLAEHFPPLFPFQLSGSQIDWLRARIFPVVRLELPVRGGTHASAQDETIRALDRDQENLARGMGAGKQLVIGPSGSGKTLILAHQAWNLPRVDKKIRRVLVTCFNLSLVGYIRRLLARKGASLGPDGVEVVPFYSVCERILGEPLTHAEESEYYNIIVQEAQERLQGEHPLKGHWDAILVDEGQDFSPEMAHVLLALLPPHGVLTVAQDEQQCLYQPEDSGWEKMGIAGLRLRRLQRQYRNTRAIARMALRLLPEGEPVPELAGAEGEAPCWLQSADAPALVRDVADAVATLVREGVPMSEIAILYAHSRMEGLASSLPESLLEAVEARGVMARWVARDTTSKRYFDITTDSVCISTINKFATLLAAICARIGSRKAKARREKSRLFLLFRLSFGVWKYRHAQALDPIRFQEADVAVLAQLVQLCPVQIGPQVCSTLAALEVGRYQQFMVDLAVQLEKRALVESQVEE